MRRAEPVAELKKYFRYRSWAGASCKNNKSAENHNSRRSARVKYTRSVQGASRRPATGDSRVPVSVQLCSVEPVAPRPAAVMLPGASRITHERQCRKVHPAAPLPALPVNGNCSDRSRRHRREVGIVPLSVQLFSVLRKAPPPSEGGAYASQRRS